MASTILIPLFLAWDSPLIYQTSSITVLAVGWSISANSSYRTSFTLHFFILVTFLLGSVLYNFPNSYTVNLMLSRVEFFNLAGIGSIFLLVLFILQHSRNSRVATILSIMYPLSILLFCILKTGISVPFRFPISNGPYAVGTSTYKFSDYQTPESLTITAGDWREFTLQINYPIMKDPDRVTMAYRGSTRILTNSVNNASPLPDAFPLILYSPGMGGSRFDNTWLVEELVSNGYIVVAIDHSFLNTSKRRQQLPSSIANLSRTDYLSHVEHGIRVSDMSVVLNHIKSNSLKQPIPKIDYSRIGTLGWSIGGSAAMGLMHEHANVIAAVNLDGWDFVPEIDSGCYRSKSFLHLKSDVSGLTALTVLGTGLSLDEIDSLNTRQMKRDQNMFITGEATGYSIRITNALHSNFRDHGILNLSRLGSIDAEACGSMINSLVLDFFNQKLKFTNDHIPQFVADHSDLSIEYSR